MPCPVGPVGDAAGFPTFPSLLQLYAVANSHLRQQSACPQGALVALKQGTPSRDSERALEGVLTHSLAGMGNNAVSMFLDVATILRGQPRDLVMAVWRGWHGEAAITFYQDLVWRSLLGADAEGRLVMHDVLVALGRGVVLHSKPGLEQHFGSRLWVQNDGVVLGVEQVWRCSFACRPSRCRMLALIKVTRCVLVRGSYNAQCGSHSWLLSYQQQWML
jgi:glucose/arabinose dehydrogenase